MSTYWRNVPIGCVTAIAVLVLLASCRTGADVTPSVASSTHHWSYEGETGPNRWATIDEDFERCASGTEQSPIDLSMARAADDASDVAIEYRDSQLNIVNNGHTIQVVYEPGSAIEIDGARYDLLQFHMHAQSEHTLDGNHFPLELHLVHRDASGNLAVVGVFGIAGEHNLAVEPIFEHMPAEISEEPIELEGQRVDAGHLLPESHIMFEYPGSLTTPPCTEGVRWFVMAMPVELSPEQIASFTELYSGNYRPLQPLNDRDILVSETP